MFKLLWIIEERQKKLQQFYNKDWKQYELTYPDIALYRYRLVSDLRNVSHA
jgi:hypothetical protein